MLYQTMRFKLTLKFNTTPIQYFSLKGNVKKWKPIKKQHILKIVFDYISSYVFIQCKLIDCISTLYNCLWVIWFFTCHLWFSACMHDRWTIFQFIEITMVKKSSVFGICEQYAGVVYGNLPLTHACYVSLLIVVWQNTSEWVFYSVKVGYLYIFS